MDIGKAIKQLRKEHGVKQMDLAFAVGISSTYLSLVEHGKNKPSLWLIAEIAKYFDISPADLIFKALGATITQRIAARPILDKLIDYLLN